MRQLLHCFLLTLCLLSSVNAIKPSPSITSNFEIAESVPLETQYGQSGIRHTQQVWLDMINQARRCIDIGAFYMNNKPGQALEPVLQAIIKAAKRGVKVRIVIERSMRSQSEAAVNLLKNIPNIDIRYLPMHRIDGGILHAKYMIVDAENCFVGSQNFDWKSLQHVHEIGLRVRSALLAKTILRVFNMDWALCKHPNFATRNRFIYAKSAFNVSAQRPAQVSYHGNTLLIHPAFSPHNLLPTGLDWEQTQLVNLLHSAHRQVLLQVLQYSPVKSWGQRGYWGALDNAIRQAAARGVHVKFIVSNWNLNKPAIRYLKSLSLVPNVRIKFSVIPEYSKGFISYARVEHAKYAVVDNDLIWVGTGNWEWSYFHDTRNVALIVQGTEPNTQLSQIFWHDWNGPYTHYLQVDQKYHAPKTH